MALCRVRAVTFDAGNTLLSADPPPPVIYADVLSRLGRPVSPQQVGPIFAEVWAEAQLKTPPGTDRYAVTPGGERAWWGAFVQEVLARLGHDADWMEALDTLYEEFTRPEVWEVFPDVLGTLDRLKRDGYLLGLISNWDSRLPVLLEKLGLASFFDAISVSSLEGVEKPAAGIFLRTLDKLGVDPVEVVHVGDSPLEDYEGARRVGLTPVLIDRAGQFPHNGFTTIAAISQLPALIAGRTST
ncbi:MAG: HAD-IA family hydrolase [Acidobacteria bacterium]|nr:HAD-IA family hydrolase [Acidobacteriota bacterium]